MFNSLFVALFGLLFVSAAHADTFSCQLTVGDKYIVEYENKPADIRNVYAVLDGYACEALIYDDAMTAYLYKQDSKSEPKSVSAPISDGVKIEIEGASCFCGLM